MGALHGGSDCYASLGHMGPQKRIRLLRILAFAFPDPRAAARPLDLPSKTGLCYIWGNLRQEGTRAVAPQRRIGAGTAAACVSQREAQWPIERLNKRRTCTTIHRKSQMLRLISRP